MKRTAMIGITLCFLAAGYLFVCYSRMEAYCFFDPSIDTRYAPGFSEPAFAKIDVGMIKEAVQGQLGQPLRVQTQGVVETWSYSLDGKCSWGDWAWLCRAVVLSNGTVISIEREIRYD